jgi:S-adenosylmethionine hydrolase
VPRSPSLDPVKAVSPIITLLTDFGAGSGYPAQMKGVILGLARTAKVVDISHEIAAFDVMAGALMLEACVPHFPRTAIHCAVVDPGVGGPRKAICVRDGQGRRFVGPDNGLFTPFLDGECRVWELSDSHFVPEPASATFHGRDLFAPVAAKIALGVEPEKLGPRVPAPVRLDWPQAEKRGGRLSGKCLLVDPFGNLITSIARKDLPETRRGKTMEVFVEGQPARFARSYSDGKPGELLALFGSGGRLEIAVREGNAAKLVGSGRGARVLVRVVGLA